MAADRDHDKRLEQHVGDVEGDRGQRDTEEGDASERLPAGCMDHLRFIVGSAAQPVKGALPGQHDDSCRRGEESGEVGTAADVAGGAQPCRERHGEQEREQHRHGRKEQPGSRR